MDHASSGSEVIEDTAFLKAFSSLGILRWKRKRHTDIGLVYAGLGIYPTVQLPQIPILHTKAIALYVIRIMSQDYIDSFDLHPAK
jgi:hypothetical protein